VAVATSLARSPAAKAKVPVAVALVTAFQSKALVVLSVAFWGSFAPATSSNTRRSGFATQSFVPALVTRVQAPVVASVAAWFVAALLGAWLGSPQRRGFAHFHAPPMSASGLVAVSEAAWYAASQ